MPDDCTKLVPWTQEPADYRIGLFFHWQALQRAFALSIGRRPCCQSDDRSAGRLFHLNRFFEFQPDGHRRPDARR